MLIKGYIAIGFNILASYAVPTAEGAVAIALDKMQRTLFKSNCLIMGYGRIGKVLLKLLNAFGADTYVFARRQSDLAWIKINGGIPVPPSELNSELKNADVIFNTVPAVLLDRAALSRLKNECLVIDLASKPGGVDFDAAKELSIETVWALSLPGKVAPVSAGHIIYNTIENILKEAEEDEV